MYDNAPSHELHNYCARVSGEELTQVYPNFPLWRERALYNIDCSRQDVKSQKDSCQKYFPTHAALTPGLYLMTCGCSYKSIYGFSLMLSGESPRMLFDIIMTRFEADYNPKIIYDASCKVQSICSQYILIYIILSSLPLSFSHPQRGSIDFNSVNPSLPRGMDFLIHPCRWIDDEENVRTPPKLMRYWEIHPLRPQDFPRPLRFPSGFALGKSLGSRETSVASVMDFPIPPSF